MLEWYFELVDRSAFLLVGVSLNVNAMPCLVFPSKISEAGVAFLGMEVVLCTSHVPSHVSEQALWRVYPDYSGELVEEW